MEPKKKTSSKRKEIIRNKANDIRSGRASLDPFAVRLGDSVKCGICSRSGRTMVKMQYDDGREEFLGKTCARYLVDAVNSDEPITSV